MTQSTDESTVDLPAFELNWTYYLFYTYLNFFSINKICVAVELVDNLEYKSWG